MTTPLVSVIIPTYKRPHYVGIAVESIIAQSYQNWECIVIGDIEHKATAKVMQTYVEKDARVQFVTRPVSYPKGVNACRNYGLTLAKGDFLALCDDDDFWLEDKLENQLTIFEKHPEVGLVTGNIEYVNSDGIRSGRVIEHRENHGWVFESLMFKNRTSAITPLFKREVIETVGNFNTDFKIFEDWEFWRRVAYYYPFYGMTDVLACVRLHDENTSNIVTTKPFEQYTRYTNLNKATLKWGKDIFSENDHEMIRRVTWKRYHQILRNHCPGTLNKLKLILKITMTKPVDAIKFIFLFFRYGLLKS